MLLTQATLKQIHQQNLYVDIDDPGDEVLEVLEECVDAAENRLPETLSRKTVDRIWNSIKTAYGGNRVHSEVWAYERKSPVLGTVYNHESEVDIIR